MQDVILYPPTEARADYERAVAVVAQEMGVSVEEAKRTYNIMPHVLKLGVYLNTGVSSYSLSPRAGVDTLAPPNTILLDQNDYFVASGLGLRFGRAAFASNVYSNHGNYPLYTYPVARYFSGNGSAAGSEAASLQTIVNGTVSVKVAGTPMIDNLLAQELCYMPRTNDTASPVNVEQFNSTPGRRGIFELTPTLILNAMADNSVVINLAPGAKANIDGSISTGTTDSGIRNILYVIMSGWKIKNFANGGNQLLSRAC